MNNSLLKCSKWALIFGFLFLASEPANSAPQFMIHPGKGIGAITLGMGIGEAQNVLGESGSTAADQGEVPLRRQGLTLFVLHGRVIRVRTTNPTHRTESGFGPGDKGWSRVRQALCNGGLNEASAIREVPKGFEIHCPLKGVIIEVQEESVSGLTVIPAEELRVR